MADRILVLEKGELAEIGSHEELLNKNGRYAEVIQLTSDGISLVSKMNIPSNYLSDFAISDLLPLLRSGSRLDHVDHDLVVYF
jgi:hypothetical protein